MDRGRSDLLLDKNEQCHLARADEEKCKCLPHPAISLQGKFDRMCLCVFKIIVRSADNQKTVNLLQSNI